MPRTGFEPARCYSLPPQSSASANSATWARGVSLLARDYTPLAKRVERGWRGMHPTSGLTGLMVAVMVLTSLLARETAAAAAAPASQPATRPTDLRVMSFNIRY